MNRSVLELDFPDGPGGDEPAGKYRISGRLPRFSSGFQAIRATTTSPPASFASGIGSTARIASTCLGKNFYFYDLTRNIIPGLQFVGELPDPFDAVYHNKLLGEYTVQAPLYLLYIDNSYGYTTSCTTPVVTLEQPTVTGVSPSSVKINTTTTFTVSGGGLARLPPPDRSRWASAARS